MKTFPGKHWEHTPPEEAGFSSEKLSKVETWLMDHASQEGFRLVLVHRGRIFLELYHKIDPATRLPLASAAKSFYACVLGIAVAEKRLPSVQARVQDYYPEMMDVPPGTGPKAGRHAFEKDRAITFEQLIKEMMEVDLLKGMRDRVCLDAGFRVYDFRE